jgi:hypothetical protein
LTDRVGRDDRDCGILEFARRRGIDAYAKVGF